MATTMQDMLASRGMSENDIQKALNFGTASFEPDSEQAKLTAEVLKDLFAAENAAGWVAMVGAAGANN